jgi:hypothetical protein
LKKNGESITKNNESKKNGSRMKGIEGKGWRFRRREKMKDTVAKRRVMKMNLNYGFLKKHIFYMCHVRFATCALSNGSFNKLTERTTLTNIGELEARFKSYKTKMK